MRKKQSTSRNGAFFLIGVLIYSILFWVVKRNYILTFGIILMSLLCYMSYKTEYKPSIEKESIKAKDVLYTCVGIIFNALIGGFPFNYLL